MTVFEPLQIRVDSRHFVLSRFLRCGRDEIVRSFYVDTPQPLASVRIRFGLSIVTLHSFPMAQIVFHLRRIL